MTDQDRKYYVAPASIPGQSVERLRESIDKLSNRYSMWTAFRNGVMTGLGATVGVAIILSLSVWFLNMLDFIPGTERILHGIEIISPFE